MFTHYTPGMTKPAPDIVREDFDRLAPFEDTGDGWNHNAHYHSYLLNLAPSDCRLALDVGCGTGQFARLLAGRSAQVLGVDLSPVSVDMARSRSVNFSNLEFEVANVLTWDAGGETFDFIVSIATLHHVPLETALKRLKALLRPGGVLAVLDLYRTQGFDGALTDIVGMVANMGLRKRYTGRWLEAPANAEARRAAALHQEHDVYPTLLEVRQACKEFLPHAEIRRHTLWRYSVVWRKPHN